ncbi:hypothetical protein D0C36_14670 [Mucilaginibacter conchicola]|uniref:Lipoprotein n=1 Tax=Mucilaginibacter conchicola TaxID=2303333 RepID=A0A372NTP8_9SPHI|nr:hypothetical protein [Mucilaginibacter conchicola]RFZ92653.1 hypothetical protein D0C36_14670 [Mucilaginibacter conchicola]
MPKALKIISFGLAISIGFAECKNKASKSNAKEFEGIITYHEVIKDRDSLFNLEDTVQLFYSHGNYVSLHSYRLPSFHLVKDYYFKDGPLRLLLFNNSDTLRKLQLNNPKERLEKFSVNKINDKILSQPCEEINLTTSFAEKDSKTYTDFTFVFSRDYLSVNKEDFKNWRLGFFNKVVTESGEFYLKLKAVHYDSSHKNILSSKTYDVISVKKQAIDPKMFEIDEDKIK